MALRVKLLVAVVILAALTAMSAAARLPSGQWLFFLGYAAAVLLSSGMKVALLKTDSTLSVNFLFILLAVLQLSPLQAMGIAAVSVFAQCTFHVKQIFSLVQTGFNVANAVNATALCFLTFSALRHGHLNVAPSLAAGAIVYFAANTLPVATVIAWVSGKKPLALWRDDFFWFFPFYLVGAALAALAHFLSRHYGWGTALLVLPAAYTVYRSYNAQIARIRDHEQHMEEMGALHLRTIESLAMAIEAKDQDTHDHLLRVRVYVAALGKALHISHAELEAVKTAALLHDIGKLAVPERIINKPGKLTAEEFEKMKIHTVVGADILHRVRFPFPVVPIVRSHHEWWNGMGYPDGLRGEQIPIGARILTVVDSFDALASDRPYRRAMPLSQAMGIVKSLSGTQFDPEVVHALEQQYVELEREARAQSEKLLRLNTDISVLRGVAPGAGFEQDNAGAFATRQHSAGNHAQKELSQEDSRLIVELRAGLEDFRKKVSTRNDLVKEEAFALLSCRLASLFPFDCLVFYKKEGENLAPFRSGPLVERLFSSEPVAFGDGLSGWAALHEHGIVNGNPTVEPNYLPPAQDEIGLHSALAIPLRMSEERLLGVLTLYASRTDAFARNHLRVLEAAETVLASALDGMLRLPTEIPDSARFQSQTDLLVAIHAAIEQMRLREEKFAVLACAFGKEVARTSQTSFDRILTKYPLPEKLAFPMLAFPTNDVGFFLLPEAGRPQVEWGIQVIAQAWLKLDGELEMVFGAAYSTENWTTVDALLACAERRMRPVELGSLALTSSAVGMA